MSSEYLEKTSFIQYSKEQRTDVVLHDISAIRLKLKNHVQWLNTYGLDFNDETRQIINQNKLDDFLIKLLGDDTHPNKMIELDGLIFVAIQVLKPEFEPIETEQMYFVLTSDFVWSIQERSGDYFGGVRERLRNAKGLTRKKKADYLFFLILEAIVDHYELRTQQFADYVSKTLRNIDNSSTAALTIEVEKHKRSLFEFKRAAVSLRNLILKLEKTELTDFENKYFSELKEETSNLISDIDFEMQELESRLNLAFSIQGDNLNQVMKTLTSYSVIFIPLTFIAGIYGMNFSNMPELRNQYGYFILLIVMVLIAALSIWYFSKRKWF
ncbi:MAG: CorA family divalent cation transporter [Mangrovibacterium sp.]